MSKDGKVTGGGRYLVTGAEIEMVEDTGDVVRCQWKFDGRRLALSVVGDAEFDMLLAFSQPWWLVA